MPAREPPDPLPRADGSTLDSGRTIAWPLVVGGAVLAVAWSVWQMASGKGAVDSISTAASGFAAFAVAVVCVTMAMDLLIRLGGAFSSDHPKFLDLDWLVPAAAVLGFGLGLALWT